MTTLDIMDARGYSLPLEGNLCFVLILVVYFVNFLAGTEVITLCMLKSAEHETYPAHKC